MTHGDDRWRRRSFRFVSALVLPLVVLAGIEGVLRLVGSGYDPDFTVPCTIGGVPSVCDNPDFTRRFFPARIARTAPAFSFPVEKSPDTYRIFVLGGSAAQGDPEPTYGLARLLGALLRERYRAARFEVVNAAITAINSHVVRLIADDLADHQGDLFVVYLGHNEVVGPYGPGSVFRTLSSRLWLIRSGVYLRGTRLGQMVGRALGHPDSGADASEWRGMEFFLGHRVRADDASMKHVYRHFRDNLEEIADTAAASGARAFLATVGVNLSDSAPFASEHRPGLGGRAQEGWDDAFRRGVEAERAGALERAETAYLEAERIDETFADLQFRLGQVLLAGGRHADARDRLALARDLDTLRFRADSWINEIIRSVAHDRAGEGVTLLDAESLLDSAGLRGLPGHELFHDHVHLSFHGNYRLAASLAEGIHPLLPEPIRARATGGSFPSEEACAVRLGLTGFDRHRIASLMRQRMTRPPFSNQFDHPERTRRAESALAELAAEASGPALGSAAAVYREAIDRAPDDPWLRFNHANLLAATGEHRAAGDELRTFLESLPHDLQARERLAAALAEQGRFEEVVAECGETIARAPHAPTSYYTLAYAQANLGRLDRAIATYRELLAVDPGSWDRIYNEIGRIEMHRERPGAAVEIFEEALGWRARSDRRRIPDLQYNFAVALRRAGREAEAVERFRRAGDEYVAEIEASGESAVLHLAVGRVLLEVAEFDGASRHLRRAVRLDPASAAAHGYLVRSLLESGRAEEAREAASAGERALREAGDLEASMRLKAMLPAAPGREPPR